MKYEAIVVIIERGKAEKVVDKAKEAGAKGATILYARGTGIHEAKKFFNINIESGREVILILSEKEHTDKILKAVTKAGRLDQPATGIAFVLEVPRLIGLGHREEIERDFHEVDNEDIG